MRCLQNFNVQKLIEWINTLSCIVCRELINGIFGTLGMTSEAISLYVLRNHIVIFDRFCWSWSFPQAVSIPWQTVRHSLPAVWKCNNHGHQYELPDLWPLNSPDLIQLTTKSGATCLSDKSAECEQFETAWLMCESWSGTERYWWCIDQWRRCFHACFRATGHSDYSLWHIS